MYLLVKSKSSQSVLLKFSRPALSHHTEAIAGARGIANVVIDEDEDEDEDEESAALLMGAIAAGAREAIDLGLLDCFFACRGGKPGFGKAGMAMGITGKRGWGMAASSC